MLRSVLICASVLAFASSAASAQDVTETTSYGERTEDNYSEEIGDGSTDYSASILAYIGGEYLPSGAPSLYSFTTPVSAADVAEAVPTAPYTHVVGGEEVLITAWSAPQFYSSDLIIRDVFVSDSFRFSIFDQTTIQLTSGDGPDAVVPIGARGFCASDGIDGATNFDDYVGAFASCDYAEAEFVVAPGTINRNTHTTTVYLNETIHFESYDYRLIDTYLITPARSSSQSRGTLAFDSEERVTVRIDRAATRFSGTVGNQVLFDNTIERDFADPASQALLASLTAPRGIGFGGAAAVVVWSAPVLAGSTTLLVGRTTTSEATQTVSSVVTVNQTFGTGSGETVAIGNRGACSSTGTTGLVNGPAPTGAVATCEGGIGYQLAVGELNTNTHTTTVTENRTVITDTDTYLNTALYALQGTAVLVGQVHAASSDLVLADARTAGQSALGALAQARGTGPALWLQIETGDASRDSEGSNPGFDSDRQGLSGGMTLSLGDIFRAGLSLSYLDSALTMRGLGDEVDSESLQLALSAALEPGQWRIELVAGKGWSDLSTQRGTAALGGTSTAAMDASSTFLILQAGPEFGLGPVTLRPFAGLDWIQIEQGAFTETGGVALGAGEARFDQTTARFGVDLEGTVPLGPGTSLALLGQAALGTLFSGEDRTREVFFLTGQATPLLVSAASSAGTFAQGQLQAALLIGDSLRLWIGGDGRTGGDDSEWRATAGIALQL